MKREPRDLGAAPSSSPLELHRPFECTCGEAFGLFGSTRMASALGKALNAIVTTSQGWIAPSLHAQNALIGSFIGPIAFARSLLQATAVENRDISSVVADEAFALQRACSFGYPHSTHAQHMP
jgi:hypothetical protein